MARPRLSLSQCPRPSSKSPIITLAPEQIAKLKFLASKLPSIPHKLTAKNRALMRQFESDRLRAELLFLPERLIAEVTKGLAEDKVDFVKAQVAIAIDFQLPSRSGHKISVDLTGGITLASQMARRADCYSTSRRRKPSHGAMILSPKYQMTLLNAYAGIGATS